MQGIKISELSGFFFNNYTIKIFGVCVCVNYREKQEVIRLMVYIL